MCWSGVLAVVNRGTFLNLTQARDKPGAFGGVYTNPRKAPDCYILRFRCKNLHLVGGSPQGISDNTAPVWTIRSSSASCPLG